MELLQQLIALYDSNEKIAIAVLSSLATVLVTKALPAVYSILTQILSAGGRLLGGRLAHAAHRRRYLDWVVHETRDLNFAGIIGTEAKPLLSDIYLSLKVASGRDERETAETTVAAGDIQEQPTQTQRTPPEPVQVRPKTPGSSHKSILNGQNGVTARLWTSLRNRDAFQDFAFRLGTLALVALTLLALYLGGTGAAAIGAIAFIATIQVFGLGWRFSRRRMRIYALLDVAFTLLPWAVCLYLGVARYQRAEQSYIPLALGCLGALGFAVSLELLDPTRLAQWSAKVRPLSQDPKSFANLLGRHNRIAILGKPGSGKSTLLQFIALSLAQEKAGSREFRLKGAFSREFPGCPWSLPIYIPLRKVAPHIAELRSRGVPDALLHAFRSFVLPSQAESLLPMSFLAHCLRKRRSIILLDGLDEVINDQEIQLVIAEIRGLSAHYPGCKLLLTSRSSSWRGGVGSGFVETELQDLTSTESRTFVTRWFEAVENPRSKAGRAKINTRHGASGRGSIRAQSLLAAMEQTPGLDSLTRTPLLLSMLCFVAGAKVLPRERVDIYRDCGRLLLEQWDIEKGLRQNDTGLTLRQKEGFVQRAAVRLHVSSRVFVDRTELESIMSDCLRDFGLQLEPERVLTKLFQRTGIFLPGASSTYSFSHLTFQEFFTASAFHDIGATPAQLLNELDADSAAFSLPWWREVLLLFVAMHGNDGGAIETLLAGETGENRDQRLALAGQCVVEATNRPQCALSSRVFEELWRARVEPLAQTDPCLPMSSSVEAFLLRFAQTVDFKVTLLRKSWCEPASEDRIGRIAASVETADLSDPRSANALLYAATNEIANGLSPTASPLLQGVLPKSTLHALVWFAYQCTELDGGWLGSESVATAIELASKKVADRSLNEHVVVDTDEVFFFSLALKKSNPTLPEAARLGLLANRILSDGFEDPSALGFSNWNGCFSSEGLRTATSWMRIAQRCAEICGREFVNMSTIRGLAGEGKTAHRILALEVLRRVRANGYLEALFDALNAPTALVRLTAFLLLEPDTRDYGTGRPEFLNYVRRTLSKRSQVSHLVRTARETLFGVGFLGHTPPERIAALAALASAGNEDALRELCQYRIGDFFLRGVEERAWIFALRTLGGRLGRDCLNRLLAFAREMVRKSHSCDLAEALCEASGVDTDLRYEAASVLLEEENRSYRAIRSVHRAASELVECASRFEGTLLKALTDAPYREADAAFAILLESRSPRLCRPTKDGVAT